MEGGGHQAHPKPRTILFINPAKGLCCYAVSNAVAYEAGLPCELVGTQDVPIMGLQQQRSMAHVLLPLPFKLMFFLAPAFRISY